MRRNSLVAVVAIGLVALASSLLSVTNAQAECKWVEGVCVVPARSKKGREGVEGLFLGTERVFVAHGLKRLRNRTQREKAPQSGLLASKRKKRNSKPIVKKRVRVGNGTQQASSASRRHVQKAKCALKPVEASARSRG